VFTYLGQELRLTFAICHRRNCQRCASGSHATNNIESCSTVAPCDDFRRMTRRSTPMQSSAKIANVFFTDTTLHSVQGPVRITGLDPDRSYELSLWDKPQVPSPAMHRFDSPLMSETPVAVSGAFLEQVGIVLPVAFPDSGIVLEGKF
jgi:hypothetical protein